MCEMVKRISDMPAIELPGQEAYAEMLKPAAE